MADLESRLGVIEEEMKLIKGEVKQSLVDLRAIVMKVDTPVGERFVHGNTSPAALSPIHLQSPDGYSESERSPSQQPDHASVPRQTREAPAPPPPPPAAAQGYYPPPPPPPPPPAGYGYPPPPPPPAAYGYPPPPPPPPATPPSAFLAPPPVAQPADPMPVGPFEPVSPPARHRLEEQIEEPPVSVRPQRRRTRPGALYDAPIFEHPIDPEISTEFGGDAQPRAASPRPADRKTAAVHARSVGNGAAPIRRRANTGAEDLGEDGDFEATVSVREMAGLVRWVSLARRRMGEDKLYEFLNLYVRYAQYRPLLKRMVLQILQLLDEDPSAEEATGSDPASDHDWSDLMLQLHGILSSE